MKFEVDLQVGKASRDARKIKNTFLILLKSIAVTEFDGAPLRFLSRG